jgi:hypothetical protein
MAKVKKRDDLQSLFEEAAKDSLVTRSESHVYEVTI